VTGFPTDKVMAKAKKFPLFMEVYTYYESEVPRVVWFELPICREKDLCATSHLDHGVTNVFGNFVKHALIER
jgi:hypothetical protein